MASAGAGETMSPNPADDPTGQHLVELIEAIVARYLAQLQAGENPDRGALLRAHPELGLQLEHRLAFVEMVHHVGLGSQENQTNRSESVSHTDSCPGDATTRLVASERPRLRGRPRNLPDYEILGELG